MPRSTRACGSPRRRAEAMADYVHGDEVAIAPELPELAPALPESDRSESLLKRHALEFLRRPGAVLGLVVLVALIIVAALAPVIAPQDPYDLAKLDIMDNVLKPGETLGLGATAWLGT